MVLPGSSPSFSQKWVSQALSLFWFKQYCSCRVLIITFFCSEKISITYRWGRTYLTFLHLNKRSSKLRFSLLSFHQRFQARFLANPFLQRKKKKYHCFSGPWRPCWFTKEVYYSSPFLQNFPQKGLLSFQQKEGIVFFPICLFYSFKS